MTEIQHLLVTTDMSAEALSGVRSAAALARQLAARVTLVFVVDARLPPLYETLPKADRDRLLDDHRRQARASLDKLAAAHFAPDQIEVAVLEGTPHEEIVRAATTIGADLIVMGTHGYGRVAAVVYGSTASRVVHQAPCPVLLVRGDDTTT